MTNHAGKATQALVFSSIVLFISACAVFWYAAKTARQADSSSEGKGSEITVAINNRECSPNEITVPAGRTVFTIINQSTRTLEWEILDGVMVVDERENIAPGFSQKMRVKLRPGQYEITCGLLTNPHGKLVVTPSAESDAEDKRPPLASFLGALAEYQVFLALEVDELDAAVQELETALSSGDLALIRQAYAGAHRSYKSVEAVVAAFSDLDLRINAQADSFEQQEDDASFRGFHRVEVELFKRHDIPAALMATQDLKSDTTEIRQRLISLQPMPQMLSMYAVRQLERTAFSLDHGGEERYSNTELANLQGVFEGTSKAAQVFMPLLLKASPRLHQQIESLLQTFERNLQDFEGLDDRWGREDLSEGQRKQFASIVHDLAIAMSGINSTLGLE